jgi:hypothetical protein
MKRLAEGGRQTQNGGRAMIRQKKTMSFQRWLEITDCRFAAAGLTILDVPDLALRGAFESGVSPGEFFEATVRCELEEPGLRVNFMEELEAPTVWVDELKAELEK